MKEIIIRVWWDPSEAGWRYYIYDDEEALLEQKNVEGGCCSGLVEWALDAAVDLAKEIIRRRP